MATFRVYVGSIDTGPPAEPTELKTRTYLYAVTRASSWCLNILISVIIR